MVDHPRVGDPVIVVNAPGVPEQWRNTVGVIVAVTLNFGRPENSRITVADCLGTRIDLPWEHVLVKSASSLEM